MCGLEYMSPKALSTLATIVAEIGDKLSPFSATTVTSVDEPVAENCDKLSLFPSCRKTIVASVDEA